MGAQGFAETDMDEPGKSMERESAYPKMDMDLFPDLRSELGGTTKSVTPYSNYGPKGSKSPIQSKSPNMKPYNRNSDVKSIIRDDLTEGLTIESILDPIYAKTGSGKYLLTLRVKY